MKEPREPEQATDFGEGSLGFPRSLVAALLGMTVRCEGTPQLVLLLADRRESAVNNPAA